MIAYLNRLNDKDPAQTLGYFTLFNGVKKLLEARVLELPYRDNKREISSIEPGQYTVVKRWSRKYGDHYHVLDVRGRSLILIHVGNFLHETKGCILIGDDFVYLDGDRSLDITNSKKTLAALLEAAGEQFELLIYEPKIFYNRRPGNIVPGGVQSA